jgi:hypothetical protein
LFEICRWHGHCILDVLLFVVFAEDRNWGKTVKPFLS